ncbi:YfiR family protein [Massilia sp. H-1]|nr:YfiR family protein [Massilia sp. H-1]
MHLLFVGGSDSARVKSLLKAAQPTPMLLVSEAENGLQMGSVINFKIVDERVRFDVSLEAADRNSVKLSSRLLTVANQVLKGTP